MAAPPGTQYRISGTQAFFLKISAIVLDGIGFLLMITVVGEVGTEVIGLTGDLLYGIWFWILGVKFFGGNARSKLLTIVANGVMEVVPFVNGVYPGFTVAVWRIVSIVKKEDEEKAERTARRSALEAEDRQVRIQRVLAARAARAANQNTQQAEEIAA
jgi:hypothetical protein